MTPILLPARAYRLLAVAAMAGTVAVALTYPPDHIIGRMYEEDEEFARAIVFFNAWIAKHPTDYEARWHTIELLLQTARPEDAVAALESMSEKWPSDERIVSRLAEVYDGLLDVPRSMAWTEKLAALRPNDPAVLQKLVSYYRWYGRTEDLIKALERYLDLKPSQEEHRELTDLLIAHRRFNEVIAFNQKQIEKRPDLVDPHLALYQAYLHSDQTEFALKELKEVIRLQPQAEDPDLKEDKLDLTDRLFELRVQELVGSGDKDAAVHLYRARIEQNPTNIQLRLRLAELYGKRSDEVAAEELKAVVKLVPSSASAWRTLGYRLSWCGKTKEAVDALQRAVALEPDKIATRRTLAEDLSALERTKEALDQYRWIVAHGGTAQDRAQVVIALDDLGRYGEAVPEAKELVKRVPSNKDYARLLARATIAAKKCGSVMRELEEMTRRFSDDSEFWSLYGLCAKQEGMHKEALEALQKAAKLHQESPPKVRKRGK